LYYQGPLDNVPYSSTVDACFVKLQDQFPKDKYNPLDYVWPQPRECLMEEIGICECSLDTPPKIQYAFKDSRTEAYDNAVIELRDLTQGYLPRKAAAYGAYLTASYSCDIKPTLATFEQNMIMAPNFFFKAERVVVDEREEGFANS